MKKLVKAPEQFGVLGTQGYIGLLGKVRRAWKLGLVDLFGLSVSLLYN